MASEDEFTSGLQANLPTYMSIAAFTAISWLNCLEVLVKTFFVFRRWRGLYFWSLLVTVYGIIQYTIAFILHFFVGADDILCAVLITTGWWGMVTGQSIVLYSRLHLIVRNKKRLRWVLGMIITNAILFHIPTSVLTLGAYSEASKTFSYPYSIIEKIQVTVFCLQECVLSGIYIYEVRKMLGPSEIYRKRRVRRVLHHLIYINILVIALDFTYISCEYAGIYSIQTTLKAAVYSYQLHLEFTILNQLVEIISGTDPDGKVRNTHSQTGDDSRSGNTAPPSKHIPVSGSESYAVSVSKPADLVFPAQHNASSDEGVMMTTEVDVSSTKEGHRRSRDPFQRRSMRESDALDFQPHAITSSGQGKRISFGELSEKKSSDSDV